MSDSELEWAFAGQVRMLRPRIDPPVREFRPIAGRRWRFDFAWPEIKLAVEVEGGTYTNGRHTRGAGYDNDCEKLAETTLDGWTVLKVTGSHIESGQAVAWLQRAYRALS